MPIRVEPMNPEVRPAVNQVTAMATTASNICPSTPQPLWALGFGMVGMVSPTAWLGS